ncbi:MAG: 50S ribosomal protein L4 [Candidatus Latescibacteria bacterium 4484_181]|nr:MAG: 50S ribosomal protein L4 [Candidatus Latescibacteria bacterium 4484_181]RKY69290.1 MAG: 50S ribosomal protein L4 [Candidatus Latescibacterota bacterium]RKY71845.1 MAG: 50S ribosomal protein L4 [Candidatus Latescibacterota bacterium]
MSTAVKVLTPEGREAGTVQLPEEIFGIQPHRHALWMAVKAYLTNRRQGTASTKGRSDVKASGRKPWRQKGTGRARAGTSASPIWVGGGVSFGPHPHSYHLKVTKKLKRLALKSALSLKAKEGQIIVIEEPSVSEPKTRKIVELLRAVGIEDGQKVLFLAGNKSDALTKSCRNLPYLRLKLAKDVCAYDLLDSKMLLLTKSGLEEIKGVLLG